MTNLRQIGQACVVYSTNWDGFFPTSYTPSTAASPNPSNPLLSLSLLYDTYIPQRKVFVCPSTADVCNELQVGDTFTPHGLAGRTPTNRKQTSYGYDDTKGPQAPPDVAIAADSKPAPEEQFTGAGGGGGGGGGEGGGGGGGGDDTGGDSGGAETGARINSANHRRQPGDLGGENVLFFNGNVKWVTNPRLRFVDPQTGVASYDNIYDATNKTDPALTDSYIHQQ
jgi:hypothetical protein